MKANTFYEIVATVRNNLPKSYLHGSGDIETVIGTLLELNMLKRPIDAEIEIECPSCNGSGVIVNKIIPFTSDPEIPTPKQSDTCTCKAPVVLTRPAAFICGHCDKPMKLPGNY